MFEELRRETFEPLLDGEFEIDFGNGPVASMLVDVRPLNAPSTEHQGRQPWSLLFRTEKSASFEQAIYRVSHPSLGALDLFLVPVGPDESGMRYEAIFA